MNTLPQDLEFELFSHLTPAEIANLSQTNSSYAQLNQNERLWEKLVQRDFPSKDKIGTWYNTYHYYAQEFYLVQKVDWQHTVTSKLFSNRQKAIDYIIKKCKHCENTDYGDGDQYTKWASDIFVQLWDDGRSTAIQLIANNRYSEMMDRLHKEPEYISELLDGELSNGQELYLQLASLTAEDLKNITHDYWKYVNNNIERIKKRVDIRQKATNADSSYELVEISLR